MRKWLIAFAAVIVVIAIGISLLLLSVNKLVATFEPKIKEQAIQYLQERFNTDVEIAALHVSLPSTSSLQLWLNKGKGSIAGVDGEGIVLRRRGQTDGPPLFAMKRFSFNVDLGTVLGPTKRIPLITLHGMEINVPPKGDRPVMGNKGGGPAPEVLIDEIVITDAKLVILPRDQKKKPLDFELQRVRLLSAGNKTAMNYEAALRNPKPPGQIDSQGTFGPWNTEDPGATPLTGDFNFNNADLGVFKGIAGILNSKGSFKGELSHIYAKGQASIPDFRLKMSGNPVPLNVSYDVEVDGTNGNTILKPVQAKLGQTRFTTSGAVLKHEGDQRRTIDLDVHMRDGQLSDLLLLAMKGKPPFMSGTFVLDSKIRIPPLSGTVKEKLFLDGRFKVAKGQFLKSQIQEKVDALSRKAQGQPKDETIDQVVSDLEGRFRMEDEKITFSQLAFAVPGALMELHGNYDMAMEQLDFRGTARLEARVSETQTGWKRWALKPVDPFFAKNGAGTFLKIKIVGDRKSPQFGLDRGNKDKEEAKYQEKDKEKDKDKPKI